MGMHSTYTATHYKDLNIDWQARAVTRHGEDILLTPQEFALLQVLFDHRGQAVSRGDLLHTAWGYPCIGITRTVDVHIQHLRRKLGLKQEIQTIYRVGYTLPEHNWEHKAIFFPFVPVKVRFITLALWYNEGIRVYLKKITAVLQAQATKLHLRKTVYFRLFRYTQGKNVSSRLDIPLRRGYPEYRNRI